jgi:hypothetical protein
MKLPGLSPVDLKRYEKEYQSLLEEPLVSLQTCLLDQPDEFMLPFSPQSLKSITSPGTPRSASTLGDYADKPFVGKPRKVVEIIV